MSISVASCYSHVNENELSKDYNKINKSRQEGWLGNKVEELKERDKFDPNGGLSRDDYSDLFYKKNRAGLSKSAASAGKQRLQLPGMQQLMAKPQKPKIANDKLVSISVTEDIPLKDVLIELSRRAEVDVEIDPGISGGVILRMKDRPFSEVIERIASLAGISYEIDDGVLRIERDVPVIRNYRMNALNVVRTSNSNVTINTDLLGGGSGGSEGGLSSGSNSQLNSVSSNGDMWSTVENGINNILTQYSSTIFQQSLAQTNSVSSEPAQGNVQQNASGSSILSLNRQAGIISVLASKRQHKVVKDYLDQVHVAHSSQVLIEAKILEVSLDDEYRSGINWNFLNNNKVGFSVGSAFNDLGLTGPSADQKFNIGILPTELLGIENTSIEATIDLVEKFGTTRTLSSPRLHTMNNQYAVLTFAENFVYFELDVEEEEQEDAGGNPTTTLTTTSEIKTIPIGVLLGLQPSIDLERNEVVMNVRPTLSRITSFTDDPAVALIAARNNSTISSQIPVVEIRELDSVLRIKSGEVMVIGGLMEERSENVDTGIPGASKIPLFGNAFKSVQKNTDTVETVIFMKATIIPGQGVTVEDEKFYKKFAVGGRKIM